MTEFIKASSESADGLEDIPSDFFDDFSKEEFMEGLSVIDSWNDDCNNRNEDEPIEHEKRSHDKIEQTYTKRKESTSIDESKRSTSKVSVSKINSKSPLDSYIKPGSRRDPAKTNAAILRDKEVKVKKHLAKHLEAIAVADLCPPGTELDDLYQDENIMEKKKSPAIVEENLRRKSNPKEKYRLESVKRRSPRHRWSPYKSPHRSPQQSYYSNRSPHRDFRHSWRTTPRRHYRRPSPQRRSPHHQPRWLHRSRSPIWRHSYRSRSKSRERSFINTKRFSSNFPYEPYPSSGYGVPQPNNFAPIPNDYGQAMAYTDYSGFSGYTPAPLEPSGPVSIPTSEPLQILTPPTSLSTEINETQTPYDALEKLVAEGKISKEDYLKLTPNKGASAVIETKTKLEVLNDCNQAVNKLLKLLLPKHMIISSSRSRKLEYLEQRYSSPLKRQQHVEFLFTKSFDSRDSAQHNKRVLDSIISTLDLEKSVLRPLEKKKRISNMKEVAVQTTTTYCDVCAIRESTKYQDTATSMDLEEKKMFCSTVHTQVVEQDLLSSKTVFNPSGSSGGNSNISIAHLTPAQLVSQLAARAKTFKQHKPPQSPYNQQAAWRNSPSYDEMHQRNKNNNYQYHY